MNIFKVLSATAFVTGGCIASQQNILKADDLKQQDVLNKNSPTSEKKSRVAVIGSGIGAASAVYFLRKLHGSSIDVDVFEKTDQCGGRLKTVDINGQKTEAGGTYILSSHRYTMEFFQQTDSEMNVLFTDLKIGIWNGKKFVHTLGKMGWMEKIAMAWQFGPFNLMNLDKASKFVGDSFEKLYGLQDRGEFFDTVPEMLQALDKSGKLLGYTQKSCDQAMAAENVGQDTVDNLINPVIRWNLGQNSDNVSGLTGFLVAAGGEGYLWNFKGGNSHICRKLFEMSNASVHYNTKISRVEKSVKDDKSVYCLYGDTLKKDEVSNGYDVVVVAAPMEVPSAYIECNSCQNWPKKSDMGCYQKRVANFIQGEVKPEVFGMAGDPGNLPGLILTTKADANDFDTIINQYQTNGNSTSPNVHLAFTQESLTESNAKKLFNFDKAMTSITSVSWLACPRYEPQERFIPFTLDSGVFYLSPMERIKGGIEMAAISGRNAALLAHNHLNKIQ